MKRYVIAIMAALLCVACSTTGIIRTAALGGARIFASGSADEREALCKYYDAHREEIEAVRAYYAANWSSVPEADKPALLRINEQLTECDAEHAAAAPRKTKAAALLAAFKRAVAIYGELKAAGVL